MIIPGRLLCDLCKNDIDVATPHPHLSYPLDAADRARVQASLNLPASILGIAPITLPEYYQFELCQHCVDGILPMLAELKTQAIAQIVAERRKRTEAARG